MLDGGVQPCEGEHRDVDVEAPLNTKHLNGKDRTRQQERESWHRSKKKNKLTDGDEG